MEEEILKMDRNQLIDFIIKKDTYLIPKLPTGREKEFFNLHPDFHTTETIREYAFSLSV